MEISHPEKNVKEATKARGLQALCTAKAKTMEHIQANKQTGEQSGSGRHRERLRSTNRSKSAKRPKSTAK